MKSSTRVAVIYGGQSTEHSVSCISAGAVIDHLDGDAYDVVPIGITRSGAWVPGTRDTAQLRASGSKLPEVSDTADPGTTVQFVPGGNGEIRYTTGPRAGELFATVDVVLPILHGLNGEDGTVQGLFELAGVRYVGNGVLASAAGMDKDVTKRLARLAGIPTGEELVLDGEYTIDDSNRERLGLPIFVKPARGGSSIGISKVTDWADFPAACALAADHDRKVIVESMIVGVEVECGVLQQPDGSLVASTPAMLLGTDAGSEGFYGFDAKYLDSVVTAEIPAPLDAATTAEVQRLAIATFEALGCEGLARVDFFVTDHGPVLNEINTLPGFTPISMYPKMFAHDGIDFSELLGTLIRRATRGL